MLINLHGLLFRRAASVCDCRWSRRLALLGTIVSLGNYAVFSGQFSGEPPTRLIGATALVTEMSSGLPLAARVDTGAAVSSIHCEAIEIEMAAANPTDNIGKPIHFLVRNKAGAAEWIATKIVDYVMVRTSKHDDWRYVVRLGLKWNDVQKEVSVTLNDRAKMRFPILLGRNFLSDEFLVDVRLDRSDNSGRAEELQLSTPFETHAGWNLTSRKPVPEHFQITKNTYRPQSAAGLNLRLNY